MQKTNRTVWLIALLFIVSFASRSAAQSSAFTYQGRLTDGGTPPTDTYDFQFKLYDAVSNGNQLPICMTLREEQAKGR